MKKVLSLFLAALLAFSLLPVSALADDIDSGTCGDEVTWTLSEEGVLTISGTGAMTDYEPGNAPWYEERDSVSSVVIESGVTAVGTYAFYNCRSMTKVTIPDTVVFLDVNSFMSCAGLTAFDVDSKNTAFSSEGGVLYNKAKTDLLRCPLGLSSCTMPDTVEAIGDGAFADCTALTSVTIPDSVTDIGEYAFEGCESLTSVTIPESVSGIEKNTFSDCTGLTSVMIPSSVGYVEENAFSGCTGITDVYYQGSESEWEELQDSIDEGNEPLTDAEEIHCDSWFTITYDANGGKGAPEEQSKAPGTDVTLSKTRPAYLGHVFLGWAGDAEAETAQYQPGSKYTADADLDLYAVWGPAYIVTYDANGGESAPESQTKIPGTALTLTGTPTRKGYKCVGWAKDKTATEPDFKIGGSYTEDANVTLYAVWEIETYTLTYDANGGTGAPSAQTATYGTVLTLSSAEPSHTGYSFRGWAATSSAAEAAWKPGGSYKLEGNSTIYAVWQILTYTVSYSANGGTGAPASQTKTYGNALTLSTTKPTRAGYTFIGWSANSAATAAEYAAGGKYSSNADVTLYAVWKIDTYTVTYNANGGKAAPVSQTGTYGTVIKLSTSKPTRSGYTFKGWAVTSTASAPAYQPGASYTIENNVVLYAVWKVNSSSGGGSSSGSGSTGTGTSTLTIVTQPENIKAPVDSEEDLLLSVKATATNHGVLTFRWYRGTTDDTDAMKVIPGAISSSYKPPRTVGTMYYRVQVTDTYSGKTETLWSDTVSVTFTAEESHEHSYGTTWEYNETSHWHECSCGEHSDEAAHTFEWTVLTQATADTDGSRRGVCTVCGYTATEAIPAGAVSGENGSAAEENTDATAAQSSGHPVLTGLLIALGVIVLAGAGFVVFFLMRKKREEDEKNGPGNGGQS